MGYLKLHTSVNRLFWVGARRPSFAEIDLFRGASNGDIFVFVVGGGPRFPPASSKKSLTFEPILGFSPLVKSGLAKHSNACNDRSSSSFHIGEIPPPIGYRLVEENSPNVLYPMSTILFFFAFFVEIPGCVSFNYASIKINVHFAFFLNESQQITSDTLDLLMSLLFYLAELLFLVSL